MTPEEFRGTGANDNSTSCNHGSASDRVALFRAVPSFDTSHRRTPMTEQASLIGRTLFRSRRVFAIVGVFSLFINLAMLNGPLFMLQVYDRVLSSQSRETLIFLTLLAIGILVFQSLVEIVRSNVLVRAGAQLDRELRAKRSALARVRPARDSKCRRRKACATSMRCARS